MPKISWYIVKAQTSTDVMPKNKRKNLKVSFCHAFQGALTGAPFVSSAAVMLFSMAAGGNRLQEKYGLTVELQFKVRQDFRQIKMLIINSAIPKLTNCLFCDFGETTGASIFPRPRRQRDFFQDNSISNFYKNSTM
jgi:hypothetical protein